MLVTRSERRRFGAISNMSTDSRIYELQALADSNSKFRRIRATTCRVMTATNFALVVAAMNLYASSPCITQGNEVIYVTDGSSAARVHALDPQTGAVIRTVLITSSPVAETGCRWDRRSSSTVKPLETNPLRDG